MYRKFDFSSNKLQYTEKLTTVPVHFNVPKNLLQSQSTSMYRKTDFCPRFSNEHFTQILTLSLECFLLGCYKKLAAEWAISSVLQLAVPCQVTRNIYLQSHSTVGVLIIVTVCPCPCIWWRFDWFWCLPNVWSHSTNDATLHLRWFGTSAVPLW